MNEQMKRELELAGLHETHICACCYGEVPEPGFPLKLRWETEPVPTTVEHRFCDPMCCAMWLAKLCGATVVEPYCTGGG